MSPGLIVQSVHRFAQSNVAVVGIVASSRLGYRRLTRFIAPLLHNGLAKCKLAGCRSISVDKLRGASTKPNWIPLLAAASLPAFAADVAELVTAAAALNRVRTQQAYDREDLRDVVATFPERNDSPATRTSLPAFLYCQIECLTETLVLRTVTVMSISFTCHAGLS